MQTSDSNNEKAAKRDRSKQEKRDEGRKTSRADSLMLRALHGRLISTDFFQRHWLPVLGIVVMLMIYITNRYTCQTQMETIQRLEKELEVAKTERIREKSTYMSQIRESKMQRKVDSLRLGLTIQEQPPYRLKISD